MRSGLALSIVLGLSSLSSLAGAKGGPGKGGDDASHGGDNDDTSSSTSSAATSTATAAVANTTSNSTSTLTGGSVCLSYMCISGVVNGSTVQYTMQSLGKASLGWMAMGFGSTMAGSPMVIMWPNSDGSITLSQRQASGEVMPTVVTNPPRIATTDAALSDLTGTEPKLAFTIPSDGSTSQKIIWAFGNTNPDDASVAATLVQHLDSGPTTIDLSKPISGNSTTSNPATDPDASSGSGTSTPLQPFQKMIVAHGLLCTIGFLILLPAGALLARFARTFTNTWFQGHWLFQFAFAGPVIVSGVALGIAAVSTAKAPQLDDDHKRWGIAIFVLYFVQCFLGAIVHWVKPVSWTINKRRPVQNYLHAVLGLLIIGIAFYQVRTGFRVEWPNTSGRPPISNAVNVVWYVWVVLIPVLYFAGLALLPKQFRSERPQKLSQSEYALHDRDEDVPPYSDRD